VASAAAVADVAGPFVVVVLVVAVDLFSEKPGAVYSQAVAYGAN